MSLNKNDSELASTSSNQNYVVFNYLILRSLIGGVAFCVPFVCVGMMCLAQSKFIIPSSISVTYHLGSRDMFVGMLTFVGAFLMAYNGHKFKFTDFPVEKVLSIFAGISAWGVALFPTSFDRAWIKENQLLPELWKFSANQPTRDFIGFNCLNTDVCSFTAPYYWVACLHKGFAITLIAILFFFCLGFAYRANQKLKTSIKPQELPNIRVRFYLYCLSILGMIGSAIVGWAMGHFEWYADIALTVVEAGCLFSFGFAWFVAGKMLFKEDSQVEDRLNKKLYSGGIKE